MQSNGDTDPDTGPSSRQLFVVAVCAVGLVVAALAMPAAAPRPSPPSFDFLNQDSDCVISLSSPPTPGQEVTATIEYKGTPVQGSRVWFNDRYVGRTGPDGEVVGTVPYERRLTIRVSLPSGGRCQAGTSTGGEVSAPQSLVGPSAAIKTAGVAGAQAQQGGNGTGSYLVRGRIDISVARQPYPGESTTIRATIRGNPVPDATVAVDGETVGRTDEDGRATITAPEQGDGTLRVEVSRGDFRSTKRVVVRRLTASIRPASALPLPGGDATVVARLGDRPAADAVASVDGERLGRTGPDGAIEMGLPADPTSRVTVETTNQTASAPVIVAFAPTVLFALGFLAVTFGLPLAGYLAGGRRGLVVGLLAVGLVYALSIGYLLAGGTGLLAVVAIVVAAGFLLSLVLTEYDIAGSASSFATGVGRLGDRLFTDTLWLTGRIESVIDGLERRLDALLGRLDASALADVPAWFAGLPGRIAALVRALAGTPERLLDRSDEGPESTGSHTEPDQSRDRSETPRVRFRRLWRRFARRVVPSEWPHRTAGEISRRAVERGMPAEPVEELTDTFRAVEYGDEPLTERQVERASAALTAIEERDAEGSE